MVRISMKAKTAEPLPHSIHKNKFQQIAYVNIKCKTIKVSGENIEECLCDLGVSKDFLNRTQKSINLEM